MKSCNKQSCGNRICNNKSYNNLNLSKGTFRITVKLNRSIARNTWKYGKDTRIIFSFNQETIPYYNNQQDVKTWIFGNKCK